MVSRRVVSLSFFGACLLCLSGTARPDELAELKAHLAQLERENQELQEELRQQEDATRELVQKIESLEDRDGQLSQAVHDVTVAAASAYMVDAVEAVTLPRMTVKVFGDLPFEYRFKADGETRSQFLQGTHDIFFLGALTDRLTAMLENDFHFHTDGTGTIHSHLERAHLRYALSDYLKITVGLQHTPIGYWNQTYHHGSWLQTTILTPDAFQFERPEAATGGILPVHALGVTLSGVMPADRADVEYSFGFYNGREKVRSVSQGIQDDNDTKAVNTLLTLAPHGTLEGLRVGMDVYVDEIPSNRGVPGGLRAEPIDELILGATATYFRDDLELIAEIFRIGHDDNASEETFHTVTGYLQGSYRMRKWTPYYRADLVDLGNGDPYYAEIHTVTNAVIKRDPILDHVTHTWGLRWDVLPWNAIKLEYRYTDNHGADGEHVMAANSSYVF